MIQLFGQQTQCKFSDNRCELNAVFVGFGLFSFYTLGTPVKILQILKMGVFVPCSVFSPSFLGLATVAAMAIVGLRMRLEPREEQQGFYLLLAWK